jgi:hypothetical protein
VHLTPKIALAAGALTLSAAGIAAAATTPDEASDGLTKASEQVGIELPASKDAHPTAEEGASDDTDDAVEAETEEVEGEGTGPVDNHGAEVSVVAQSDATTGREHGEAVSTVAQDNHGAEVSADAGGDAAEQSTLGAANAGGHGRP